MEKYKVEIKTELGQGQLTGIELLTAFVFADSEEIAKDMADKIMTNYTDSSNVFKHLPLYTTIGIKTTKV
ncbi:hypothetical protein [uncultured Maribacter sp.]|uniref:hypothetical protein n=1 Tax=uncultured Maribacter sp. TaxID=431308 RepID=UPI0030DC3A99|tara:strand:+ start:1724 stop:1933 length:210 start_codon:yes stop_codon:yes gene_type:complete